MNKLKLVYGVSNEGDIIECYQVRTPSCPKFVTSNKSGELEEVSGEYSAFFESRGVAKEHAIDLLKTKAQELRKKAQELENKAEWHHAIDIETFG